MRSRGWRRGLVAFFILAASAAHADAQVAAGNARGLTLEEALRMAEGASEDVRIAQAGVQRARGEQLRARSEYFPQLFGSLGYTRTLESEFSALSGGTRDTTTSTQDCGSFTPNPGLPLNTRVDSLEAAVRCQSTENPFAAFADLPFGREHQYNLGLSLSQTVFAGGRLRAQSRVAQATGVSADIALTSSRAQLMLDVAQAYYDAALADRLVAISQATLQQAETTLRQVRVAREVGDQPEFELLRAQVTRDTQEPLVIQRTADRDLAYMRLKQLLNLPLDQPLTLTTELVDAQLTPVTQVASEVLGLPLDTAVSTRAPVRQAQTGVDVQENLLRIARAQRLPTLSLSSQYGRVGYPTDMLPPSWNQFRTNWTVSASAQVPLFTGRRIKGEEQIAQANLAEARARFDQTRELAALDARDAAERLEAAEASWRASAGTVEQANKAFTIAEVRFREGASTQLELADSRILLQQAQANRAQAGRNLQVARMRVALLPYLPLGAGQSGAPASFGPPAGGAATPAPLLAPRQTGGSAPPMQAGQGRGN